MKIEEKICFDLSGFGIQEKISTVPRPLVMTNGVFDIIHRGHVEYLSSAAALGSFLIVAVNTDESARALGKGPGRPINSELDRAFLLAALQSVDLVVFFETAKPVELIRAVRPDIYVKGGDYDMDTLEETRVVRSWGGQSKAIPYISGFSTTNLVERIRNKTK